MLSEEQQRQIKLCKKADIDPTPFLTGEYNSYQIAIIRFGVSDGVDVKKYMYPYFDYLQMDEIRRGLKLGIDTDIYAHERYTWKEMAKIRRILMKENFK